MPLIHGHTDRSIRKNIRAEVRAGRPQGQAVAIALNTARAAWRKAHPMGPFPKHIRKK